MMASTQLSFGLNIHANNYLFDNANITALDFFGARDDATSLADIMRSALSNTSILRSWNYETEDDFGTKDLIHSFAEQVDDMANTITMTAAMLLDEFELYSSSPTNFTDDALHNVSTLVDAFQFNDTSPSSLFNLSLTSVNSTSWLQGIEHEVSVIEAWEIEAEKLSLIAIAAFQNLKSDASSVMANVSQEAMTLLKTKAGEMFHEIETEQEKKKCASKGKIHSVTNKILLDEQTWKSGGFEVEEIVHPSIALEIIKSLPLKTYKLRDDKQRDLGVSKGERRTRYHVGVIDQRGDNAIVDPSAIFSYNIGAVSQLAASLERISSILSASMSFIQNQASLNDTVSTLKAQTELKGDYLFKSPSQLASEVAALETEAALTRTIRYAQSVAASIRINLINSRLMSQLKSHASKSLSSERSSVVESDSIFEREVYADVSGSYLDRLLIYFEVLSEIKAVWTATEREFAEIHEEAKSQSRIAMEEVHAEAAVERENEASSLDRIQLVGKARMNEIIHVIELFFRHLSECLQHIVTPQGREQFMFYVGAVAALVFAVLTLKEMITLGCICILRFVTAPRLVREYGNLNTQFHWFSRQAREKSEIVLPINIKERVDVVVKVASVASKRHLPLRSVLIYGEPGSGKSMAAKAIAQSIPDLPYALMTGADVYPMGSQGPAELRRLLTWASQKRNGGIIIIDQAEAALGSRAKVESDKEGNDTLLLSGGRSASRRYSRDCLNVLLSMTGIFGNIMLILTTSNPSELDEAVLDRMDEIIYIPLPSALERSILLRNKFFRQFKQLDDGDDKTRSSSNQLLSNLSFSSTKAPFALNFDAEGCVFDLAVNTRGLSGRELEKIIQGVMFKTHSSVSGILDLDLWRRETEALIKAVASKHQLKS